MTVEDARAQLRARSRSIWAIERNAVMRRGVVVATITHLDNKLGWRGLGIERVGFENEAELLADVKHFYRYPPVMRITFRSGRVVTN